MIEEADMRFSIIVVCLNAGGELQETLKSITEQSFRDYEIIIKDGGSTDGSLEKIPEDERIRLIAKPDLGIYDAMNQALEEAAGEYVYFLNCGDYLMDSGVLQTLSDRIDAEKAQRKDNSPLVIYGDILERASGSRVASNPVIDEFACYRNVPCHQACIYERDMLRMHPFNTEYRIRADYEQFLWCYFIARAAMIYEGIVVASYMGGGFSAAKENKKRSAREHKIIVENYMPHSHVVRYRWRLILSLAPLRRFLAENSRTSGLYNAAKSKMYDRKQDRTE